MSTVSRVLAGEPGISEGVKTLVLKAAGEVGYPLRVAPGAAQRPLAGLAGARIGLLLSAERASGDIGPFYDAILAGLREESVRSGFDLSARLLPRDRFGPDDLGAHDATLAVGLDPADGATAAIAEAGVPVVLVNGADPLMRLDCVSPDNFYGGALAARALLALGHRDIVYLAGQHRATTRERARGFRQAVADQGGATGHEVPMRFKGRTFDEAAAQTRAILAAHPAITAIFCMNDAIALGALAAAESLGRRIPDDLSVLGFDDLPCATMMTPRLSTVRVDRRALAREAADLLARRLADRAAPPRHVQHAVALVAGGTLAPPPSESSR